MRRSCSCRPRRLFVQSELFIPKRLVKKLSGRKRIVTTVKSMTLRPWEFAWTARSSAKRASIILACCCLSARRLWSCGKVS